MNIEKPKPIFEKRLFWDVDFEKLEYDAQPNWIIERVFERGDVEDIRQCRRYYGDDKIREIIVNSKTISNKRVYLFSAILDVPIQKFKCYILQQLTPELFHF